MNATHHSIVKSDRRGRLRYTKEQKSARVAAYQSSGLSGPRFAGIHGVKVQTLASWLQKRETSVVPAALPQPGPTSNFLSLIPAEINHGNPTVMRTFSGSLKVFVAVEPCDMRRSFNGLHDSVANQLGEDPKSGAIFASRKNTGEVPTASLTNRAERDRREQSDVPRRGGSGRAHQTPIRYLQPGSGKARTGDLWVSDIPRGSVFFHWHPGRDASGLDALFAREPVDNDTLAGPQIDELVAIIQWPGLEACLTAAIVFPG